MLEKPAAEFKGIGTGGVRHLIDEDLIPDDVAIQVLRPAAEPSLGVPLDAMFGVDVLTLHPPKSREKIAFLLGHSEVPAHAGKSAPPQAMMINIPDRMLMIKVSQMVAADGRAGTCMIFYDLTELTTAPRVGGSAAHPPGAEPVRLLSRIPVYRHNRIMLVDVKDIGRLEGDGQGEAGGGEDLGKPPRCVASEEVRCQLSAGSEEEKNREQVR